VIAARPFRLRLIHWNDLHGRLADVSPGAVVPVFSRIAGFIRQAREAAAGRPDMGVLALSGGDDLVGSPFADLAGTRAEQFLCHHAYRLYSAAGVDACGIGNHDLDWGLGMLSLAAARDARFPLLSANLVPAAGTDAGGFRPFVVVPVNGVRVGIIGLTTGSEIKGIVRDEFEILDPLAAALDVLPQVKAASDVVIVLSHLGYDTRRGGAVMGSCGDVELARALPAGAVATIVGSHTHTVLHERGLDRAQIVNGTLIAQAGGFGRFVGEVIIELNGTEARAVDARLWTVEGLPDAPEFEQQFVSPPAQEVRRLLAEPVGVVSAETGREPRHRAGFAAGELALANLVADALAARCRAAGLPVDFAMVDVSSVGGSLPPAGPLTYGDLFRLSPYADSVVLLRLPAHRLPSFLDDNARRIDLPDAPQGERGFVQFSREVRYAIRLPRSRIAPAGSRSRRWPRGRRRIRAVDATLNGEPLASIARRDGTLLIACSSFLRQLALRWERRARNGLALFDLEGQPREMTHLAVREELTAYAREMGGATEAAGLRRDSRVRIEQREEI
jgi:5'-nucleotidase / UDP-sugar diphosphatase